MLQYHHYNRSTEYARLERLFGLEELMVPEKDRLDEDQGPPPQGESWFRWRDLIPVIKVDVSEVRIPWYIAKVASDK